ncbi:outer membrane protein, family [gut metagenome]|uniref:Outer membrane protein, family n=1 Tax=gut metagenome TaxID=749906 RepID=J9FIE7_9ZZZZ
MKRNSLKYAMQLVVCFTLWWGVTGCSTTKNLPADETLYVGVKKMEVENEDQTPAGLLALEEVEAALSFPPNNAILGSNSLRFPLPFGLWMYNDLVKYQEKKGLGNWLFRKLASTPVLMSKVNPEIRAKVATNLLRDYGFFNGQVSYRIDTLKNPRKTQVSYHIDMANPYYLDSIMYLRFPARADSLIRARYDQRLLHKGDNFSVLALEAERQRLSTLFRNQGYYFFRPDFITFRADTLRKSGWVSLQVVPRTGIPADAKKQYRIGRTSVYLTGYKGEQPTDSLVFPGLTLHYSGKKPGVRPQVLARRFFFQEGQLYSQARQTYTQEAMARLGIFKFAEFRHTPRSTSPDCDTLDVRMNAAFDLPYDGEFEFNVTTKSTDQTGPGAIFSLSRKNFMRRAATLSFQLKGSYEWQTNEVADGSSSKLNSYEIGASFGLEFPRLILPWKNERLQRSRFPQHTTFKLYVNQLNRARFFKMLSFGGVYSYDFQPNLRWKHTVTPFRLSFNTLQHTTTRFDSIIATNPSLAISLGNQFIPAMDYTFTYDNAWMKPRHHLWWETSFTSAGNVTSLLYAAFGKGVKEKNKKLLNSPYAQFLKMTSEVRCLFKVGEKQHVATRLMGGILYAYGNQTVAPYSEQFYIGGANSIRAFTVRSIGPGTYRPTDKQYGYLDETGDIKLEANVEYRFPVLGDLYGAAFLDAGNVWLLRKQTNEQGENIRPGGELTLRNFGKSIALGTGFGLRYDLTFLVIRCDLGIALHAPYDTGKRGYYNIPKFSDGLGFHFAIGYPF